MKKTRKSKLAFFCFEKFELKCLMRKNWQTLILHVIVATVTSRLKRSLFHYGWTRLHVRMYVCLCRIKRNNHFPLFVFIPHTLLLQCRETASAKKFTVDIRSYIEKKTVNNFFHC